MTSKQIGYLSMSRRVLNFLKKNLAVFGLLPSFNEELENYEGNLQLINTYGNQQRTDISGLRTQKEAMKLSTGKKALDMSHRIEAYAKITGDVVLAKKIHYTDTDLLKASDSEFMSGCVIIETIAEEKKTELAPYGVTPELLADLKASIGSYSEVMDTPKEGYTGRKQATHQLNELFDTQGDVIEKVDALVEMIRYTNPALYTEYWDTRKVVTHSGSLTVKCEVTDAATGEPLAGALVTFVLDGIKILEKTTYDAGGLMVKSMSDGTYTVTVSRLGYVTQTLIVNVLNVELTTVKVALVAG